MLKQIKEKFKSFSHNKGGLTLVELIVTVAILAITSAMLGVSYVNVMEDQRQQSDLSKLNNIDTTLKQVLLYDDAFEDVEDMIQANGKLTINFLVTTNDSGKSSVDMSLATINDETTPLSENCKVLYKHLCDQVGYTVQLSSANHKQGFYRVFIEFKYTEVSKVRPGTSTNDVIKITNSGSTDLGPLE